MRKSTVETLDGLAQKYIAQGCTTYSKRSDQYVKGVYPTHATCGDGQGIIANGLHYTDYVCGLGSNLDGYHNNHTLPYRGEPILAQMVCKRFPFIEKLKFVKTGSAACEAAVRIARAYKQKGDKYIGVRVLTTGYHGCSNIFISCEEPGSGTAYEKAIKEDRVYGVISTIRNNPKSYGVVIIEPVALSMNVKKELLELRRLCTKHDIVLVFDEIITGYRVPKFSVSSYFGIYPDIICLGKAIANGYPLAIVGGKARFMDTEGYFISNTHNSEAASIDSAIRTMRVLDERDTNNLWARGKYFQAQFNKIWPAKIKLIGIPTRATWEGDEKVRALFWQEMCLRGYLFGRAWFINFAHTYAVIDKTLAEARDVLKAIKRGHVKLKGQMPRQAFQRDIVKVKACR